MVVCLTSARFNMKADILRSTTETEETPGSGTWVIDHDPDSNEIIRKWVAADNPETPTDESSGTLSTFRCEARGIIDGGIRVAGTTERWGQTYEGVDYVRITFPANVFMTRRDRVTNIRTKHGKVLWREEERTDQAATIFSVVGVTPVIDPFGAHIENVALLERTEVQ